MRYDPPIEIHPGPTVRVRASGFVELYTVTVAIQLRLSGGRVVDGV